MVTTVEQNRIWRQLNPHKVRAQLKRHREKYPEGYKAWVAAKRAADPDWDKKRQASRRSSIIRRKETLAGRPRPETCELCGSGGRIVFDHCHTSVKFRGWLCDNCNKALGLVRDDPDLLRRMATYLEQDRSSVSAIPRWDITSLKLQASKIKAAPPEPVGDVGEQQPSPLPLAA